MVQRVLEARVEIVEEAGPRLSGAIGPGLLVLIGVKEDDTLEDARYLADKTANLRIFEDEAGKMNRSVLESRGSVLVVSNFTLYGDARKGRRPSFIEAARGEQARELYLRYGALLTEQGLAVHYGEFGATMRVVLINDGPVTMLLDSRRQF